ncbi:HAD family hydrolase [Mesorhizobium sp. VK22B]|uniref:phosphoserine phosphatase n=1 Tax=Mesorhizobium captivum TaxID=3072319 RepID=A0ABU4ZBG1_9HYPH|nr:MULTISPECIES: HAD family hydrolase [unclassified Mesorhizobium]MDX8495339.1 HAD family hydrolase [Mesorhizobium sp. VK22B]MDX8510165.1 HAD family hydrolase [Mesorhizobium sp. VK22E]
MRLAHIFVMLIVWMTVALLPASSAATQKDALPSWNDGPTKQAIIDFVAKVTSEGGTEYVAPAERIAVFDNDGTLWAEQPLYFQFLFAIDRVKALSTQHPEWKDKEPFASLLKGDLKSALADGEHAIVELITATHSGMSTEEFRGIVQDWLATATHPKSRKPYTQMVYQPMLELLAYLRANGFKTFIVTGGGIEFVRSFAEETYGIPPEQVVGSSGELKFQLRGGTPLLEKLPAVDFIDDGDGKPVGIQMHIGRRPIAAFGNSDGDLAMLQWTCAGGPAHLCLFIHHTDGEREWAYDRASEIGKLDKGLDAAADNGWTVVDMKNDWRQVFGK